MGTGRFECAQRMVADDRCRDRASLNLIVRRLIPNVSVFARSMNARLQAQIVSSTSDAQALRQMRLRRWGLRMNGQRIEGRRVQVAAGLVWSVVEVALPSVNQVRLRRGGWRCLRRPPVNQRPRVSLSVESTMKVTVVAPLWAPRLYIARCSNRSFCQGSQRRYRLASGLMYSPVVTSASAVV
jgi:hypothetical protein